MKQFYCSIFFATLISILFFGCKESSTPIPNPGLYAGLKRDVQSVGLIPGAIIAKDSTTIYVLNEGGFNQTNSTLAIIQVLRKKNGDDSVILTTDAFQKVNGRKLGSLGNSMAAKDSLLYLVMNGSDKIEIVRMSTLVSVGTITLPGGSSPRQIVFSGNRGYVTSLYKALVYVVDLSSSTVVDSIAVGNNPDGIVAAGSKIFVANSGFGAGNTVSMIDASSNTTVKTIHVSDNPVTFEYNSSGNEVLALCAGSFGADFFSPDDDTEPWLYVLDGTSGSVKDSLMIGEKGEHPSLKYFSICKNFNSIFIPIYAKHSTDSGRVAQISLQDHRIEDKKFIHGPPNGFYTAWMWDSHSELILTDYKNGVVDGDVLFFDVFGVGGTAIL